MKVSDECPVHEKDAPVRVHPDFYKKLSEIRKYYGDKHNIDLNFRTATKIIADRIRVEDVDLLKNDGGLSFRKKLRKINEVKSGFGYTDIMR